MKTRKADLFSLFLFISLHFFLLSTELHESRAAERVVIAYPSPSATFLPLIVAHRGGFFCSGRPPGRFGKDFVRPGCFRINCWKY